MANANVNITVTANSQQAQGNLKSFSNKFTEMYSQMMLVKQGAEIVGGVFKKAFELAQEGAQIELLRSRLDNLTASIGTTSDALMSDLRDATRGLVSDADLMKNATDIISLGLADTSGGVVDLAKLISSLGWDMQTVIMTFANNSKMRLDALGLSVTDVEARMKALEAQGYDTDKAFDMAVIDAGKAKLELLGDAADTNAGSWKRLQAEIDNAKMALQEFLGKGLTPYISGSHDMLDAIEAQIKAAYQQGLTWDEFLNTLGVAKPAMEALNLVTLGAAQAKYEDANATRQNEQEIQRLMSATTSATEATKGSTEAEEAQITTLFELVQAYAQAGIKTGALADKQDDLAGAMKSTEQAMNDLKLFVSGPLGNEYDNFIQQNTDLEAKAAELRDTIAELGGTEWMTPAQAEQITALQANLNNVTAEILALDESIQSGELKNNQEYAATQKLEDLRQKAWELEQQITDLGGKPFVTSGNLEDLEAAREELAKTNEAILANAAAHDEATKRIIFDLMAQRAAADGLSEAERKVLNDLALSWGLIDQATHDAVVTIDQAFSDLAAGESITEVENQIRGIDDALTDTNTAMLASNDLIGEKGVGAMKDYRETLLDIEEPLTTNEELIWNAAEAAKKLNNQLNAIPEEVNTTVNITTNGSVPNLGSSASPENKSGETAIGLASGISNFVIPPGHPNDTFGPVYLSSGEVMNVTPAGQAAGGMSGGVPIVNVYLDGQQIAAAVEVRQGQSLRQRTGGGPRP